MKNTSTLTYLAGKIFESLRDGNDEPKYTYTDRIMRKIVPNSIKGS